MYITMKSPIKLTMCFAALFAAGAGLFSGCAGTPTRESTGEYVDDASITTKVKAAFVKDDNVKAREVSVETFKGVVQLSGFVSTQEEKGRAGQLAAGVVGVRDVKNNIVVK